MKFASSANPFRTGTERFYELFYEQGTISSEKSTHD